jgi:hypothetical protein
MLADHGIRVISISENTGNGPAARMVEGIIERVDEFHSANMAADIKHGMRTFVERGFYLARSAPTGYKKVHVKDGGKFRPKLELDPPWNQLPRRVWQLALRDYGLKAIVTQVNKEGFLTKSGARPRLKLIYNMIKNPHYTGHTFWDYRNQNDNYAKSHEQVHSAIITEEEFETVQRKLAARRRTVIHPRTAATPHLFTDLGTCSQCGAKIAIKGSGNNKSYYFVCNTRFKRTKQACNLPRYPIAVNDPIIMDAIIGHVLNPANLRRLIHFVQSDFQVDTRTINDKLADIDAQLTNLDSRESQLLLALEMQTFETERVAQRMSLVTEQRATLITQR